MRILDRNKYHLHRAMLVMAYAAADLMKLSYQIDDENSFLCSGYDACEKEAIRNVLRGIKLIRIGAIAHREYLEKRFTRDSINDYRKIEAELAKKGEKPELTMGMMLKNWDDMVVDAKLMERCYFHMVNYMKVHDVDAPKFEKMLEKSAKSDTIDEEFINSVAPKLRM